MCVWVFVCVCGSLCVCVSLWALSLIPFALPKAILGRRPLILTLGRANSTGSKLEHSTEPGRAAGNRYRSRSAGHGHHFNRTRGEPVTPLCLLFYRQSRQMFLKTPIILPVHPVCVCLFVCSESEISSPNIHPSLHQPTFWHPYNL